MTYLTSLITSSNLRVSIYVRLLRLASSVLCDLSGRLVSIIVIASVGILAVMVTRVSIPYSATGWLGRRLRRLIVLLRLSRICCVACCGCCYLVFVG